MWPILAYATSPGDSLKSIAVQVSPSKTGQGQPFLHVTLAVAATIVGVALAFIASGATAASKVNLTYKQSVKSAHFKADSVDDLAPGSAFSRACWHLAQRSGSKTTTWCAARNTSTGSWKLTGKKKGAKIEFTRSSALLALDPGAAGIAPGLYKWSFSVSSCGSESTPATGSTGAPAGDCTEHFPPSGGETVRIHSLVPSSCKVKGAAQVNSGPRRGKKIALTFDDGPAPITPRFLKQLKSLKVHATFFMIGQQVHGHGALLKRMMNEGHELANHSWNHANLGGGGPAATSQIVRTNDAIEHASGFRPCVMRPPYGASSSDLVHRVRAQHMTSILWNVDPLDWRTPGVGTIVGTIRSQTHAGSIILEHDGGGPRSQTLAAIPQYVHTLKSRGYKFVTVSELLGYETTYRLNK